MGKEDGVYRGAKRDLSESALRLNAAMQAARFAPSMDAAAERARNLINHMPTSHRKITDFPLHTMIPNPPITRTITFKRT